MTGCLLWCSGAAGSSSFRAWRLKRSPPLRMRRFTLSLLYRIGGHKREFSLTDITIQRPFAEHETVPPTLLMIVSIVIPAAFIAVISTAVYRSKWDLHGGLLGLLVSYTVTGVVTQVVKMGVGR